MSNTASKERAYWKTIDMRMFDFIDFYTWIADEIPDNAKILEVGVGDGCSACYLAEALLNRGKTFRFWWIDSLAYGADRQMGQIMKVICQAGLAECVEFLPVPSLEASARFPDEHFDFVFIDSTHKYEYTKAEIREWYQKVKEDGILAGHDYNFSKTPEVVDAVNVIVPKLVVRPAIANKQYEPEPVLQIAKSIENDCWWVRKKFYVRLN